MIIKNIESKIRLATFIALGSFVSSIIICLIVGFVSFRQVANARKSIYILDHNNVPLRAAQTDMRMNRPAEYRAHVDLFHTYFFSLTPDDEHIDYQMRRAMYLIDESGAAEYNNLKEKGLFSSILATSSVLTIRTDSIHLDEKTKRFRYYGTQVIDRRSSRILRSVVTDGYLKDIPRSENNPHGVLITGWKTLENRDIDKIQKNAY